MHHQIESGQIMSKDSLRNCLDPDFAAEEDEELECTFLRGREAGLHAGWMKCTHKTSRDDRGEPLVWYGWNGRGRCGNWIVKKYWLSQMPDDAWLPGHKPNFVQAQEETKKGGSSSAKTRKRELQEAGEETANEEESCRAKKPKDTHVDNTCCVCMVHDKTHLFVPCGHQCVCGTCAETIMKSQPAKCPVCRSICDKVIKVFY